MRGDSTHLMRAKDVKMSATAADMLYVDRHEWKRFLAEDDAPGQQTLADGGQVVNEALGGDGQVVNQTFTTIAIFLVLALTLFVLVTGTLICYSTDKRRKLFDYQKQTGAELPNDSISKAISKPAPLVAQTKGNVPLDAAKQQAKVSDQLWKLNVERCDVSAGFDKTDNKLQVKVRRITWGDLSNILLENACMNFMVAVQLGNDGPACYFESKVTPLQGENLFDEHHDFDLTLDELPQHILKIAIHITDRYSQHRVVQQYHYHMTSEVYAHVTLDDNRTVLPVTLTPTTVEDDGAGIQLMDQLPKAEVAFSLCYMPTSGRLTAVILTGKNISAGLPPTYCHYQAALLVGGNVIKTVASSDAKKTPNLVFNEAVVFHIPLERVQESELVITLSTSKGKDFNSGILGKVIAGTKADTEVGRQQWSEMLSVPRHPIAQWHSLENSSVM